MATELEQKPVPQAPAKHESFVEHELAKVRGRIRTLDAGGFLLLFLIATLGYALLVVSVDRAFDLPTAARLGAFVVYLGVAGFLLFQVGLCFWRRVNPYYAARQLEQSLPDAKNSIINWLDLRDEKLPPAIRSALGVRAAKDLKQADPEKAVNSRLPLLLGAVLLGLVLAMLVLFVMESGRFSELLGRAFAPFGGNQPLGSQTTITLVQPEGGDATVPLNRAVPFRVRIDGPVPPVGYKGAPRLLYRYNPAEPYDDRVSLPLEEERDGAWVAVMASGNVRTGFWYKVTAGDAETPEYQIRLRSSPDVTRYEITYRYRPYLKLPEQSIIFPRENEPHPKLVGRRGTEVSLIARTNRKVRDGRLELQLEDARHDVQGKPVANDPTALRFELVLDKRGAFHVHFTSKDAEEYSSSRPYEITIIDDRIPTVELTKPGQDVELPANGTLMLEGYATDDVGLKAMALRLRVLEGADRVALAAKTYREGKTFQLIDESYPQKLDYKDLVALDKLKTEKGAAFPLTKGMVLEYWLEATDNADYPNKDGNVGRSKTFKVTIKEPEDPKKQEQQRKDAEKQAQDHNNRQDKNLEKENQAKRDANNPQQQEQPPDPARKDQLEKDKKKLQDDLNELQKAQDKRKEEQKNKGEAKGGEPDKAEPKPGNPNKENQPAAKNHKPKDDQQTGAQKNEGQNGKAENPAQARDAGNKDQKNDGQASSKTADNRPDASAKGSDPKTGKKQNPSEAAAPKEQPKDNSAEARDQGGKTADGQTGQAKDGGKDGMKQEPRAGAKQPGKEQPGAHAKNEKGPDGAAQQPPATASKGGPKDEKQQVGSTKNGGDPKKQPDAGAPKNGDQQLTKQEPGGVKGGSPKADEPKATVKQQPEPGGMGDPKADVKNTVAKGEPQGKPKQLDPKQADKIGQARGDPKDTTGDPKLDKALDDIAKLREQANSEDQKQRDEAAKALDKMAREAEDPRAREAAKQACEECKGQGQAKANPDPKGNGQAEAKRQSADAKEGRPPAEVRGDPKGDPKGERGKDPNGKAKNGDDQKIEPKYIADGKPGGENAGHFGPGGQGLRHDPKNFDPNAAFSKKGGELNLDQLKNVSKKVREDAGWTEERWNAFLKAAEAYNRALEKEQGGPDGPTTARGQDSKIGSSGPRIVNPNDPSANAAQVNQPQPPLEFRDIYRNLTRPDALPPKK